MAGSATAKVAQKDGTRRWVRERDKGQRFREMESEWENRDTQTRREELGQAQRDEGWRDRDTQRQTQSATETVGQKRWKHRGR